MSNTDTALSKALASPHAVADFTIDSGITVVEFREGDSQDGITGEWAGWWEAFDAEGAFLASGDEHRDDIDADMILERAEA